MLFWNLLENAINYNKWNNIININLEKNYIEIQDQWIWIEKEEITKIFNRFYRNKNSWIYYPNWNWLGLSIVKKVVDLFWWKIDIKSEKWLWTEIIIKIKDL
jgi:signal transduction histidine kinase